MSGPVADLFEGQGKLVGFVPATRDVDSGGDHRRVVDGGLDQHGRVDRYQHIRVGHHGRLLVHVLAAVVTERAAHRHRLDDVHMRIFLFQLEDLRAFIGKDLGLVLKVTRVQTDQQLRRLGQRVGRDQLRQRFDIRVVGRKVDEAAGVRDQLAVRVEAVQLEIFVARHQPLLAEISIVGRDAADADLLGIPIRAVDQLILLELGPAGGPLDVRARDVIAGRIVPADDDGHVRDSPLGGFAQQVAVHAPARGGGDDQVGLVSVEEVGVQIGREALLNPHQEFAGPRKIPQQEDHQRGGDPDPQAELPAVLGPHLPDVTVHCLGVDAARAADAPQVGQQPLHARLDLFGVVVGLLEAQTFEGQARLAEARRDLVSGFVVGEDDNFNARLEQRRDDVALQEVDDCHAVVGGNEDSFRHRGNSIRDYFIVSIFFPVRKLKHAKIRRLCPCPILYLPVQSYNILAPIPMHRLW